MTTTPTPEQVMACPMFPSDSDATTVGEYVIDLLATLWQEGSDFSGKRPFGNSGWQYDVYTALGKAGLIEVVFDEDGYVETLDVACGGCGHRGCDQVADGGCLMAKPALVYSSTGLGKSGVIPKPAWHIFIVEHANGQIRAACSCRWKADAQTFDYDVARAQFDVHASEPGS